MSKESRVVVIGLDAVETPLLVELMSAGRMPALQKIADQSVDAPVDASGMSSFPGAIWQDIGTGSDSFSHGNFFPIQLHGGEGTTRHIDPNRHAGNYYYDVAAAAGLDVIVVDQPLVPHYDPPTPLINVFEWHAHDALYGLRTVPEELLDELTNKFGTPPHDRCDTNHATDPESLAEFAQTLVRQLDAKVDMLEHLMLTKPWDLFTVALSQAHCVGHQLWHIQERFASGDATEDERNHVVDVYLALDSAVGRLVDLAGEATIVLFTSHGMGTYAGGPQLLPALMREWGYGDPRKIPSRLRRFIPVSTIQKAFRRIPGLLRATVRTGVFETSLTSETKAIPVINLRVGAIRLNVIGREPDGCITESEIDAELNELERRFMALVHPNNGEPIVDHVLRPAAMTTTPLHADLPDLLIVFRRDLGEITDVVCPEAGAVHVPIRQPDYPRTGDHTDQSHIWVRHEGAEALGPLRSIDIAPTILGLAGVEIPDTMTGRNALIQERPANHMSASASR